MVCQSDECYPSVFEPTQEWQVVMPDQIIPGGLHVRMNFETGKREAKLLDNDTNDGVESAVIVVDEELAEVVAAGGENHEENDDDDEDWGATYSHKPNPHITLLEHQEFDTNLAFILSSFSFDKPAEQTESAVPSIYEGGADESMLLTSLKTLEDFAHEIDFGIKLSSPDVITVFLNLTNAHPSSAVRSLSARIVGTSLRNNSPALHAAGSATVVTKLLHSLSLEPESSVRNRIMFALASSIHGRHGRKEFWANDGGSTLRKYFAPQNPDEDYLGRCGTFVEDSFLNEMMNVHGAYGISQSELQIDLGLWCHSFQNALSADNIRRTDVKEKLFSALSAIKTKYPASCPVQNSFRVWIAEKVKERELLSRDRDAKRAPESGIDLTTPGPDALAQRDLVFLDKLSDARHALFGNPKAARKAFDTYHDEL
ncbi:hypothetical protein V1512DRAFT_246920 [Lipomyces arxii]|uniref:uncharacterized protein n=1 Tax=Lipomyces arxii TaxID=56418 RepID=UPI0034CE053B